MGKRTVLVAWSVFALGVLTLQSLAAPAEPEAARIAEHMVDALAKGDFAKATAGFDATMKAVMPADKLRQLWSQLAAQEGAFKRRTGTRVTRDGGNDAVLVTCRFERAALDLKVVLTGGRQIGGLWIVPASTETRPSPSSHARFVERAVTVGRGEWRLPGLLAMPRGDGPFPAVVLVHGSGSQDRDETIGPNHPFRDLAWGLASRGIAVLRYDKRTYDKRAKARLAGSIGRFTVKEEVIDDALAAVSVCRHTRRIDPKRVYVLGHSLGGMLMPRIGKADPAIAGLIVMAGPARPLEDATVRQLAYLESLPSSKSAEARQTFAKLKRDLAAVKALTPASTGPALLLGAPPAYWLDLRGYSPATVAKSLRQRVLVLQGARDYQVTTADFMLWKAALAGRPNATLKLYPDLNHLLMTGKGKATPAEYERPGTVAAPVIADIARWIGDR